MFGLIFLLLRTQDSVNIMILYCLHFSNVIYTICAFFYIYIDLFLNRTGISDMIYWPSLSMFYDFRVISLRLANWTLLCHIRVFDLMLLIFFIKGRMTLKCMCHIWFCLYLHVSYPYNVIFFCFKLDIWEINISFLRIL